MSVLQAIFNELRNLNNTNQQLLTELKTVRKLLEPEVVGVTIVPATIVATVEEVPHAEG